MLAIIPYTTFPKIQLGPIELRTFGLMVGLGVLTGAWVAARHIERYGIGRDETYRLATRLVVAGIIGARITWDITHFDQIHSPLDLIAVWEGGLQFSGGFIAAVAIAYPTFKKWSRVLRWRAIDGYGYGLTIGLALGRVGCYSVGEHFGSASSWLLAVRFDGGSQREPAEIGSTFHSTALYEFGYLVVLFGLLTLLARRHPPAGTLIGAFCLFYGTARFLSDFLRVNDDTVLGLTGAQYLMLTLPPAGIWIMRSVRRKNAAAEAELEPDDDPDDDDDDVLASEIHEDGGNLSPERDEERDEVVERES